MQCPSNGYNYLPLIWSIRCCSIRSRSSMNLPTGSDLLRPTLADLGLGLDDVTAAVGVPGVDVDPTDTVPRD
jgi:hypothetical protein